MPALQDPVCGMPLSEGSGIAASLDGRDLRFCSEFCRSLFLESPAAYAGPPRDPRPSPTIAYFTMEIGLNDRMPTYAGGLGILAGDSLKAFADLEVPVVGVSLVHRRGYFRQVLDPEGAQTEHVQAWDPARAARPLSARVQATLRGRTILIQAWEVEITGCTGFVVPLILLDTDLPENTPEDRELTSFLYGGDARYRLAQEIVLGVGGLRMLRALGYTRLSRFHMNEGHSAFLGVELLRERMASRTGFASVREQCVFTTHTPVPAGHDQFDYGLVREALGEALPFDLLRMLGGSDRLNMTLLALNLSGYVNGVAKKHGLVSQEMFPGYPFHSITNGVHSRTWTSPSWAALFDRHVPGWGADPFALRHALSIPDREIWGAHQEAKNDLIREVMGRTGVELAPDVLTIGFARRATPYKRADLLFTDPARLREISRTRGPLQVVLAGKAHPRDEGGKAMIRDVVRHARELAPDVVAVYLQDYGIDLARICLAGVDLWLNTPLPPLEASGTSGMKSAHNGVPSLSVLDGWWCEGRIEGKTGWTIEGRAEGGEDARDLYRKLEEVVLPLYQKDRTGWIDVMRHAIALNASYFNAQRMVQQYLALAYA